MHYYTIVFNGAWPFEQRTNDVVLPHFSSAQSQNAAIFISTVKCASRPIHKAGKFTKCCLSKFYTTKSLLNMWYINSLGSYNIKKTCDLRWDATTSRGCDLRWDVFSISVQLSTIGCYNLIVLFKYKIFIFKRIYKIFIFRINQILNIHSNELR